MHQLVPLLSLSERELSPSFCQRRAEPRWRQGLEGLSELSCLTPPKAPKFARDYGALALERKLRFPRVCSRLFRSTSVGFCAALVVEGLCPE